MDSVTIDFDNKRIECSLPLRGKPEDFLSDNRYNALKVLDSQCKKKVQNDEVIKSFYKLFDGKFAVRFDELPIQELILSKSIQHYLPSRVIYKQSLSTPCRTVMDVSTKTPLLESGEVVDA